MNILIEKNLMVPMRDGVKLATDVYRPAEGGPVPVLLARLPYNKELPSMMQRVIDARCKPPRPYICRSRSHPLWALRLRGPSR